MSEIWIERNRILAMGLNGIGVYAFFQLTDTQGIIKVDHLTIIGNVILRCLTRTLAPIVDEMQQRQGYGGISLADSERLFYENLSVYAIRRAS